MLRRINLHEIIVIGTVYGTGCELNAGSYLLNRYVKLVLYGNLKSLLGYHVLYYQDYIKVLK